MSVPYGRSEYLENIPLGKVNVGQVICFMIELYQDELAELNCSYVVREISSYIYFLLFCM